MIMSSHQVDILLVTICTRGGPLVGNGLPSNTTSLAMVAVPYILTTICTPTLHARLFFLLHTTLCCPRFASRAQKVEPRLPCFRSPR